MATKSDLNQSSSYKAKTPLELFFNTYTVTGGPHPPRCLDFTVFRNFIEFTAFAPKLRPLFAFFDFNVLRNFNEFKAFAPKLRKPKACFIVLRMVIYTI